MYTRGYRGRKSFNNEHDPAVKLRVTYFINCLIYPECSNVFARVRKGLRSKEDLRKNYLDLGVANVRCGGRRATLQRLIEKRVAL